MVEATSGMRHGAAVMLADQVAAIQVLFEGDAWQHMTRKAPDEIVKLRAVGAICAHVLDAVTRPCSRA